MRRRDFVRLFGGAAAAWPLAARAQQNAVPVVGFLNSQSPIPFAENVTAFRQGLRETGFIEGQNVAIEYRWADGQNERLSGLAGDLVQRRVAVIAATGASAPAAVSASKSVPIVFTTAADPVAIGLVTSLNRPGGNVTGVTWINWELEAKQLELLREAVPGVTKIAVISNPISPGDVGAAIQSLQAAARRFGLETIVINDASTEAGIEAAFTTAAEARVGAILMRPSAYFSSRLDEIVALELLHRLPTAIVGFREAVPAGIFMSYGASIPDSYRQAGVYVGRILKGAKPADLPVMQPTKFELLINVKTAKTLGLTVPNRLLAIADEVIE